MLKRRLAASVTGIFWQANSDAATERPTSKPIIFNIHSGKAG